AVEDRRARPTRDARERAADLGHDGAVLLEEEAAQRAALRGRARARPEDRLEALAGALDATHGAADPVLEGLDVLDEHGGEEPLLGGEEFVEPLDRGVSE